MVDEIKRALEIAEIIPFRYLIQHIGVGGEEFDMRKFDAAFIVARGDQRSSPASAAWRCCSKTSPTSFRARSACCQFEELTHMDLNFVFDTGHANMNEGVEPAFDLMKERIRSTHVHDNDGKSDIAPVPVPERGRHHRLEEHDAAAARPRATSFRCCSS